MSIKWYVIAFSVFALIIMDSDPVPAAEKKIFINGIDAKYPPFTFIRKSGDPDGLDIKAVDWIAREMGFPVKHVPMDWGTIIPSLKAKKIDFIASGMSVTQERKREIAFSIPYYRTAMVLVANQDSNLTVDEALAGNLKWGVQRGTSEVKWVKENLLKRGTGMDLVLFDSAALAMEAVIEQNIDCAAVSFSSASDFKGKGKTIRIIGNYGQPDHETAYGVRKEDKELLHILNKGLRRLMSTPFWKELKMRYGLR